MWERLWFERCETIDFCVLHFDLSLFSLAHDAAELTIRPSPVDPIPIRILSSDLTPDARQAQRGAVAGVRGGRGAGGCDRSTTGSGEAKCSGYNETYQFSIYSTNC